MSRNIFYIGDTHFGWPNGYASGSEPIHNDDGSPLRPLWSTWEEADEAMIERWNSVVGPYDKVYHLGDVAIKRKALHDVLPRLNGKKRLVRGNHDIFNLRKDYLPYFEEVYGVRVFPDTGVLLSHIPLQRESVVPRFNVNVHGHTHLNYNPDPVWFSVCVEMIDFTPIEHSTLMTRIEGKRLIWQDAPREQGVF